MSRRVLFEDVQVVPRLFQLRLPKDILLDVLDKAVGERANVTGSDPLGTPGTEMRRWTTRFLRDDIRLRKLGWKPCAHSQIEGIRNDSLQMKVAFMNTDQRTGVPEKSPANVSDRGSVAELLIAHNCSAGQSELFDVPAPEDPILAYDFWYLCAYVGEKHVAAELSRPTEITNSFVSDYSERIILWRPGDKPGLRRPDSVPEDFAEIELPTLTRI